MDLFQGVREELIHALELFDCRGDGGGTGQTEQERQWQQPRGRPSTESKPRFSVGVVLQGQRGLGTNRQRCQVGGSS